MADTTETHEWQDLSPDALEPRYHPICAGTAITESAQCLHCGAVSKTLRYENGFVIGSGHTPDCRFAKKDTPR